MLTREAILSITDKAVKEVDVPEWGGSVFIKGLTFDQEEIFSRAEEEGDQDAAQRFLVNFICNADGIPLFTEADIPELKKKSVRAFTRIVNEVKAFNSLEGAEKN